MPRENYSDDQDRAHRLYDAFIHVFVETQAPASDPEFFEVINNGLAESWGAYPPASHDYPRKDS